MCMAIEIITIFSNIKKRLKFKLCSLAPYGDTRLAEITRLIAGGLYNLTISQTYTPGHVSLMLYVCLFSCNIIPHC